MKLKNITSSDRELRDNTGKCILVKSKKTIELDNASYNENAFKIIKEYPVKQEYKVKKEYKHIEQKEEIKVEKEVI